MTKNGENSGPVLLNIVIRSHENHRLRVHSTQEWYDLYQESTNDELQKFFDKYTKGLDNGWELTPRVRVSLLGFNQV